MRSDKDKLDAFLGSVKRDWDIHGPDPGHRDRFSLRLGQQSISHRRRAFPWNRWRVWGIAASFALIFAATVLFLRPGGTLNDQVDHILPEASHTRLYFTGLLEGQVHELQQQRTPPTQKIVDDALAQLNNLEADYRHLARDLVEGGSPEMILSAMITNFQTRIDLIKDVMLQIRATQGSPHQEYPERRTL